MFRILPYRVGMDSTDLARLRAEYADRGIVDDGLDTIDHPVVLFQQWFAEAVDAAVHEPNAMALATATSDGRPSVRIVLLKGIDDDGLVFFTGYESRKGIELAANPRAAATMLWHPLQRQVRIEGPVERIDPADSDAYFHSRPRGAQISAAASPQSHVVEGRADLDQRRVAVEQQWGDGPIPRPENWGGYRIGWESVEFWQGRRDRFHDRLRFTQRDGGWSSEWLAP